MGIISKRRWGWAASSSQPIVRAPRGPCAADWGQVIFGGGLFSWLAIESVLLGRMLTGSELAAALRPTLGIQLAPGAGRRGRIALFAAASRQTVTWFCSLQ
jgi:tellurite resistance protein TehA-like permease